MKSLLLSFQTQLCQLNLEKKEAIEKFKEKLERVKEGNYDDKRFIEQMVMLVERKKREKVQVNMQKGTVYILQWVAPWQKNIRINANIRYYKKTYSWAF